MISDGNRAPRPSKSLRAWLAALGALIALPGLGLLVALPDPDTLGDPVTERYLPPGSLVWCTSGLEARLCSPTAGALPGAQPVRHWLGTDLFGRDVLSRLLGGARSSLRLALAAMLMMLAAGTAAGLAAALSPRADLLITLASDLLLSLPRLFVLLLAIALYRPGPAAAAFVIAATSWMGVARLVRSESRALLQRDFISAAKASGAARSRLAATHLLPHLKGVLLAAAVLRMPDLLLLDAALGYLGISSPPPAATLGGLMGGSGGSLREAWWLGAFPGLWVVGTSLAFAGLAEALRGRSEPEGSTLL